MQRSAISVVFALALAFFAAAPALAGASIDIYVNAAAPPGGDGSAASPHARLTDAVVQARAARAKSGKRIVIHVAAGTYVGSYKNSGPKIEPLPIIVNVRNLSIVGATVLTFDAEGLPTGFVAASATVFAAEPALDFGQRFLVVGGTPDGASGDGVTISQCAFDGRAPDNFGNNGFMVEMNRVAGFVFEKCAATRCAVGVVTTASSGVVRQSFMTNASVGICLFGGNESFPASVDVLQNRSAGNREGGFVANPEPFSFVFDSNLAPLGGEVFDTIACNIIGNDFSDNFYGDKGLAWGIRLGMNNFAFNPAVTTTYLTATIRGNRIANNSWGVMIDAAFPFRFRPEPLGGFLTATFEDNEVSGNRESAIVSFTRYDASLARGRLKTWKYFENSLYDITDLGGDLAGYLYDNPAVDPEDGTVLDNVLKVNGVAIPQGTNIKQ